MEVKWSRIQGIRDVDHLKRMIRADIAKKITRKGGK
jgi:hypothetical protein